MAAHITVVRKQREKGGSRREVLCRIPFQVIHLEASANQASPPNSKSAIAYPLANNLLKTSPLNTWAFGENILDLHHNKQRGASPWCIHGKVDISIFSDPINVSGAMSESPFVHLLYIVSNKLSENNWQEMYLSEDSFGILLQGGRISLRRSSLQSWNELNT